MIAYMKEWIHEQNKADSPANRPATHTHRYIQLQKGKGFLCNCSIRIVGIIQQIPLHQYKGQALYIQECSRLCDNSLLPQ